MLFQFNSKLQAKYTNPIHVWELFCLWKGLFFCSASPEVNAALLYSTASIWQGRLPIFSLLLGNTYRSWPYNNLPLDSEKKQTEEYISLSLCPPLISVCHLLAHEHCSWLAHCAVSPSPKPIFAKHGLKVDAKSGSGLWNGSSILLFFSRSDVDGCQQTHSVYIRRSLEGNRCPIKST